MQSTSACSLAAPGWICAEAVPFFQMIERRQVPAAHQRAEAIASDQAGAALAGEVVPGPLDEHQHFIVEANQKADMDEQPDEPGHKATNVKRANIGHGRVTACQWHLEVRGLPLTRWNGSCIRAGGQ